jgi:hypothetical protein
MFDLFGKKVKDFSGFSDNQYINNILESIFIPHAMIKEIFIKAINSNEINFLGIHLEIEQLLFSMSYKLLKTTNLDNNLTECFYKLWYEMMPLNAMVTQNNINPTQWNLYMADRERSYNKNYLKILNERFNEKYILESIELLSIYLISIIFNDKIINITDNQNENENIIKSPIYQRFGESFKSLLWKIYDTLIMPKILRVNNIILNIPKSIEQIIDYINKNILIVGAAWRWKDHYNKNSVNKIKENEVVNEIINYLKKISTPIVKPGDSNNFGWNVKFPVYELNNNITPLEANIYQKEYEIKCAKIRDWRLKYLVTVYEHLYNEKLQNPKEYIYKDGDDFLLNVYSECIHVRLGRLDDGSLNFILTEEDYIKYFTQN